jgi:hypothetical protein
LREWIEFCTHNHEFKYDFPLIAEGSEHRVYLDAENARVVKATRPGLFGEWYYIRDDKVHQSNCRPLEYLARLLFWKQLFGSAPISLGVTAAGQIVSSHEFITGELPSQIEVDSFLKEAGFSPIKQRFWLWEKEYRPQRKTSRRLIIRLGDARDENFVKAHSGIVPIDIRLWGSHSYVKAGQ